MDVKPGSLDEKTVYTVLITGANSGLGFSTCCRLIDEFLFSRPQSQTLHLIFSTRDAKKGEDTLRRLNAHLQKTLQSANGRTPGISRLLEPRIKMEGVLVDLVQLRTVKALAQQLLERGQRLDAVIWNAGIAGWITVNWVKATWEIMKHPVLAVTCPEYMYCDVGLLAGPQLAKKSNSSNSGAVIKTEEPPLGKVFTANVFGHYMLTHWLAPLFNAESRVIWISSTSAVPKFLHMDDIQSIGRDFAYECSKRLTDLLVLTSELPSTRPWTTAFLPTESAAAARPKMYVTHPGCVTTSIVELPWFMIFCYIATLYIARWLGSPWHCIDPYKGAVAVVYAALAPPSQLENREEAEGKGKWGTATDFWGEERVARTEVSGWGFCGKVGVRPPGSASIVGQGPTTKQTREDFEADGRRIWQEMEALRVDWEKRLGTVDAMDSVDH